MGALDLGILVSGSGTNLQAVLDAVAEGRLAASVRLVVSNKADAFALERARRAGVPTRVLSHREHTSRESFDTALAEALREAGVSHVVLAGFMRVLGPEFLSAFPGRVVNIHPALLPAFPGLHAQEQALRYGVKVTGCTVHFVDAGVDTGPIIAQRSVPVLEGDSVETLSSRILLEEHRLLVQALEWLAEDRLELVRVDAGRTTVRVREA